MSTVLAVQSSAWRKALVTGSVVLIGIVGLLVMHGLSFAGSTNDMATTSRFATRSDLQTHVTPAPRDPTTPMKTDLHRVLGCLWLLVVAASYVLAIGSWRRHGTDQRRLFRAALAPRALQRAPPTSVRLSLVGISRR